MDQADLATRGIRLNLGSDDAQVGDAEQFPDTRPVLTGQARRRVRLTIKKISGGEGR